MFRYHLQHAILIWILTSLLGSAVVKWTGLLGLQYVEIVIVALVFSLPALLLLIPNFFVFDYITRPRNRIIYGLISVLFLCGVVALIFLNIAGNMTVSEDFFPRLLIPYILSAILSFFAVARRFILKLF